MKKSDALMVWISLAGLGVAVAGLWLQRRQQQQRAAFAYAGAPGVINPYTGAYMTAQQATENAWL